MNNPTRLASSLLAFLLALSACREAKVTAYRAAKDAEPSLPATPTSPPSVEAAAPAPTPPMANASLATAAGNGLTWSAPATWKTKPATPMRKGSYAVGGTNAEPADLSITAFPGAVGGELANLNRWRGQLSLPPVEADALESAVTRFQANGLTFTIVDCVSAESLPRRILGAMTPYEGAVWFFKLTGPDTAVGAAKPEFLEFLKTVKAAPAAATP